MTLFFQSKAAIHCRFSNEEMLICKFEFRKNENDALLSRIICRIEIPDSFMVKKDNFKNPLLQTLWSYT